MGALVPLAWVNYTFGKARSMQKICTGFRIINSMTLY